MTHECESHAEDGVRAVEAVEHDPQCGWLCEECVTNRHHPFRYPLRGGCPAQPRATCTRACSMHASL